MARKLKAKAETGYGFPGFSTLWSPNKSTEENLQDAHYFARFSPDRQRRVIIWPTAYTPEIQAIIDQKKAAAAVRIEELKAHPTPVMIVKEQARKQSQDARKKAQDEHAVQAKALRNLSVLKNSKGRVPAADTLTEAGKGIHGLCLAQAKEPFTMGDIRKAAGKPVQYVIEKLIALGAVEVISY